MAKQKMKPTASSAAAAAAAAKRISRKKSVTDDGTPVVNATKAQIRNGLSGRAAHHLVRIPQVDERSRCYVEAATVIGEREALALPYNGGRTWRCEVRVSDGEGACGTNRGRSGDNDDGGADEGDGSYKRRTNYKSLTPLFRWYRGSLVLATIPYILEDIVEVDSKIGSGKKRWANGMSDDEGLDSSDEEWDSDRFRVEPITKMSMEASALTESARSDKSHPSAHVSRSWISPDLQRFNSRKSALTHAEDLVRRDLLIDRTLYGYGHNGARLRPVKPTRKQALEAGMARFLRDGIWIVGQEEMWIKQRRDVLVKKQEKRHLLAQEGGKSRQAREEEEPKSLVEEAKLKEGESRTNLKRSPRAKSNYEMTENEEKKFDAINQGVPHQVAAEDIAVDDANAKVVSPAESEASANEGHVARKSTAKQATGTKPPPTFTPSTHYRLTKPQIDLCFSACIDHYEGVMRTVKARSLHHELADGFDVLRERGRGRYDMELSRFDSDEFSFLNNPSRTAWMPIVNKILGEDAMLVHKGCFLSLPGSETQVYHQDGVHLNTKVHKPCYAVNVFIPLVDCDMTNGPTEFCLGTHFLGHENFVKENVYTPCVNAGTPVIFDYRLGHRGLRNFSQGVRPVVYLTYSSVSSGKEFRDSVNFSRKRYKKLGSFTEKPLSREERAKKRRIESQKA